MALLGRRRVEAVDAGDSIVLPAGRVRRVVPGPDGVSALVTAPGDSRATLPDGTDRGVPDRIA
ncbi:hypothetical protein SAMN05216377_104395 [Pseudonocardia oroxyli]|uniref:Uncharacterized protein n=1 Tax=Pseudonocardia oroxyli TaxID=366584 RepID=A0A1G7KN95_PSEOR|nr:hypothetical protein SAMN05216377_104395 [Pseudonocardia oroxyli]